MRHRIAAVVVLLGAATALAPQPALAQGSITLANGAVNALEGFYSQSFFVFWSGLRLDLTGSDPMYSGSATGSAVSYEQELTEITTSGHLNASYDREAELLRGEYSVTEIQVFHKETASGVEHMETTNVYQGRFQADLLPSDTQVKVDFEGTMSFTITGDIPPGWFEDPDFATAGSMDWDFSVTFDVTADGIADTATTTEPTSVASVRDSGARFSGLGGLVRVNIPEGIGPDGEYIYESDPSDVSEWNFAKLDMVLPAGTMIHTGEDASMILSFADLTTFTAKPDTTIILGDPTQSDSILRLLAGNLWVNVNKMVTSGQMDIPMGQAVAGIKGTTLVLGDDGTTSTLKVIDGTVELTSLATGAVEQVTTGQLVVADAAGLGAPQPFDVAAETAAWAELGVTVDAAPEGATAGADAADTGDSGSSSNAVVWVTAAAVVVLAGVAASLVLRRRKPTT